MKRLVMIAALALAISSTALAGDVPGVDTPAPGNTQGPSITATVILTILSLVRS